MKRRKPLPRSRAQTEILEKGCWSRLRADDEFHSPAENAAAWHRCRQLIEGGAEVVDWLVDLHGQK